MIVWFFSLMFESKICYQSSSSSPIKMPVIVSLRIMVIQTTWVFITKFGKQSRYKFSSLPPFGSRFILYSFIRTHLCVHNVPHTDSCLFFITTCNFHTIGQIHFPQIFVYCTGNNNNSDDYFAWISYAICFTESMKFLNDSWKTSAHLTFKS